MKKNYVQPSTEIVSVGTMAAVMLTTSPGSTADSSKPVLSKERNFVNFADSYESED